jgi:hypothetical protein
VLLVQQECLLVVVEVLDTQLILEGLLDLVVAVLVVLTFHQNQTLEPAILE